MNSFTPMNPEFSRHSLGMLQTHPAINILRLAALSAGTDGELDDESLSLMTRQVKNGAMADLDPAAAWQELERGLMSRQPSNMIRALFSSGALSIVLPEVAALFGVPQIANDPPQVDLGQHLQRVLDQTARCNAPLPVRFAALVMNVGKFDSPPEHLPVHYRHVERGGPRIEAICERFGLDEDCRVLALMALGECERVHRVSDVRAGPIAAMLERLGAFNRPERFWQLMQLCDCDFRAYPGQQDKEYTKSILLDTAIKACAGIDEAEQSFGLSPADTANAVEEARAAAIATAFRSVRWSNQSE
jgi:tRNA nucleotidyltransferase (CCA-adding enzyme)